MKIKCSNCNYEWDTTSKLKKVTCPNCGNKTWVKLKEKNNE